MLPRRPCCRTHGTAHAGKSTQEEPEPGDTLTHGLYVLVAIVNAASGLE